MLSLETTIAILAVLIAGGLALIISLYVQVQHDDRRPRQ